MRLLFIISLIVLLLIGGCTQAKTEPINPESNLPRYTADQVIEVAMAYSPQIPAIYPQCEKASWEVIYKGQGIWVVNKYCIDRYGYNQGILASWYFYEDTGVFKSRQSSFNLTHNELVDFLETDETDEILYTDGFGCRDFAMTLYNNAKGANINVGFVSVQLEDGFHALNVFNTDDGLVFVDCSTGYDAFVQLEIGKPYTTQYTQGNSSIVALGGLVLDYRIAWDISEWTDLWP